MEVLQKVITLPPVPKGAHVVTSQIVRNLPELKDFKSGTLNVFLQHTTASLILNENVCEDVRVDLMNWLNKNVPKTEHNFPNGDPDDMPAHIKASILTTSITIPIIDGKLALGTWQGIYFVEHRAYGGSRRVVLTITGTK